MNLTDPQTIQYIFGLGPEELVFTIGIGKDSSKTRPPIPIRQPYPEWTKLESSQCPNCPLSTESCIHCPAAVRVHVVRAADLTKADLFGKSDPFVQLTWRGEKVGKTQVIKGTLNPVWEENESFLLPLAGINVEAASAAGSGGTKQQQ